MRKVVHKNRARLCLDVPISLRMKIEDVRNRTNSDSMTEVIRRAVDLYEKMLLREETGTRLFIKKDGEEQELILA